jgi:hypothetical protein
VEETGEMEIVIQIRTQMKIHFQSITEEVEETGDGDRDSDQNPNPNKGKHFESM